MINCISQNCDCIDPGCNHSTLELEAAKYTSYDLSALIRIDMIDQSPLYFCPHCADDALESGLFTLAED